MIYYIFQTSGQIDSISAASTLRIPEQGQKNVGVVRNADFLGDFSPWAVVQICPVRADHGALITYPRVGCLGKVPG